MSSDMGRPFYPFFSPPWQEPLRRTVGCRRKPAFCNSLRNELGQIPRFSSCAVFITIPLNDAGEFLLCADPGVTQLERGYGRSKILFRLPL